MITKEKAEEIVKELLSNAQERFKQELIGENEDVLDKILRQFKAKVARRSWKVSQKWTKWNKEGPVLMPDYTRIYYRKGNTEVILQEFPPQVRLMKFRAGLVLKEDSTERLDEQRLQQVFHYSLALPYVVFIFKFINGKFSEVKCAFSDRSLKTLDEKPLMPYLSNIDNTLMVCLGRGLNTDLLIKDQLAQQVAMILDHFWHSTYSEDWSGNYWTYRRHFNSNDKRLASLANWQEASQENSLFVIEDVEWMPHTEKSFGDMVVKMFLSEGDDQKFQEDLYLNLTDEFMESIKKTVQDNTQIVANKIATKQVEELTTLLMAKLN